MQSCRLRALSRSGSPHIFTPADVPVRIWEDAFILANVPNSPTLLIDSVVRMMDNMDVGEGDIVRFCNKVCTVSYNRGFIFTSEKGAVYPSNQVPSCEVLSIGSSTESVVRLRTDNVAFRLPAILGVYGGKVVTAYSPDPCSADDIKVSAGFVYQRQKLCYGDEVEGKPLIMGGGRPCIKTEEGYIEIPTHFFLGKE